MEKNTSKYENPCALCGAHVEYPGGVYLRGGKLVHTKCLNERRAKLFEEANRKAAAESKREEVAGR